MQDYDKALVGTLCDLLLHQESPQVIWQGDLLSIMHWALLFLMETVKRYNARATRQSCTACVNFLKVAKC